MSTTISRIPARTTPFSFARILGAGVLLAIGTALANVVVFVLARDLLGISFAFPYQGAGSVAMPLPVTFVILASGLPAILAALLLAVLGRLARRPLLIFQGVGVIFLLVSSGGPISVPAGLSTKLALGVMHIVAATIIIGGLSILAQERPPRQAQLS